MIELQKTSYLDQLIRVEPLHGDAFTDEQGGHKFIITCYQNGEKVNLTGTVSAKFMRPGGTVALTGSVSDGQAVVTLSSECYERNGAFVLTVFNTVSTTKFVCYACSGNVRRSSSSPLIDGGEIIDSVEDLISDIQTATAAIPVNYNASFAPAYSTSSTYNVGDYATYDGYLWCCATAITTAETWDSTHWVKVALGNDVSVLRSAVSAEKLYDIIDPDTFKTFLISNSSNFQIDTTNHVFAPATTRILAPFIFRFQNKVKITTRTSTLDTSISTNYFIRGHVYNSPSLADCASLGSWDTSFTFLPDTYYAVEFRKTSNASISASEMATAIYSVEMVDYHMPTDKTLLLENVPADAKKTGELILASQNDIKADRDGKGYYISSALINDHGQLYSSTKINDSNLYVSDSDHRTFFITVSAYDYVHLDLETGCRAIFQTNRSRPSSGTNTFIKGDPIVGPFSGAVRVPVGAAALAISYPTSTSKTLRDFACGMASEDQRDQQFAEKGYYYLTDLINGTFASDGGIASSTAYLYTGEIPVKKGDRIYVNSGSLLYGYLVWKESLSSDNRIQYSTPSLSSYITQNKFIEISEDGFAAITLTSDGTTAITPSSFNGEIRYYPRNDASKKELPYINSDYAVDIASGIHFLQRLGGTHQSDSNWIAEYYYGSTYMKNLSSDMIHFTDVETILIVPESGISYTIDEYELLQNGDYKRSYLYPLFQQEGVDFKKSLTTARYFNLYPERYYRIDIGSSNGTELLPERISDYIGIYKVDNRYHIPEYYKSHIDSKIDTINNNANGFGDFSFVFITDIHARHNTLHSPALLREVLDKCAISTVIGGGDWNTAYNYSDMGINALTQDFKQLRKYFAGIPMIKTVGNHEWAYGGFNNPYNVSTEWVYDWYYRDDEANRNKEIVYGPDGTYFYQDDLTNKVRYVSINVMDYESESTPTTGHNKMSNFVVGDDQIAWLKQTAFNLPGDEWFVVPFSHVPIWTTEDRPFGDFPPIENAAELEQIVDDFLHKTDYASAYKGTMLCWIAGHTHRDSLIRINNGTRLLTVNGDCFLKADGAQDRVKNSTSEQAFDVFTVKKSTRTVYVTRIGAGSDRSFNY